MGRRWKAQLYCSPGPPPGASSGCSGAERRGRRRVAVRPGPRLRAQGQGREGVTMSGSRQAGSGSAGTSPGSSAASSVTSASSSLSSSPSPPSVAASAATLVSGGVAPAAGSGGLGGPGRPVLVAAAVSGSASAGGAVSAGLSRLSCAARPSAGVGGSSSSLGSSSRKRPLIAPLCNGLLNSYEDKSNDFVWWVCIAAPACSITSFCC